ncbi:MAG TPA: DNA polymerase III subunit beta [Caulobacteraceae bacterium]|nr:DNA polymerase III subunit beta [Caulobacteraceae bacterium]
MKLTIERAALLKALGHVQSVVERRNTIPILSNVLLSANQGQVAFSATDLDMEIADSSPAQVEGTGQITAPAHTLYEIVRKLPEGADVSLSYTGEDPRLQVQAGRSRFNLPVLPAGDFPVMSSEGLSDAHAIDTTDLIRLIDKTRFAISTEETRYYLNGLYLHAVVEDGEQKLRAVATDGRRLALAEMPAPEGFSGAPGVIIPRKTINEARRLMDDAGETISLAVSSQKVRFGFDHASMTSKVIDGSFPPYERVIPRENRRVLTLDNALFAAAVDRVATISTEQSRAVRLSVESGRITLTVRNMDAGQAVEEVEVDYDGEPFEIGFNARYILDVTSQIGGEIAEFRFAEHGGGATVLDPTLVLDPTDAGVQYVLMPLRA